MLTAAHVVESAKNSRVKYAPHDIQLVFGNPGGTPVVISGVKVGSTCDFTKDFAVLELPRGSVVPNTVPFRGRALPKENGLRWETYGYSRAAENTGQQYGGVITTISENFQMRVDPAYGDASGLSGSPCLVDGEVVGVVLETGNRQVTDVLFAISSQALREAGCSDFCVTLEDAPYFRDARFSIKPFEELLPNTAFALGLASSPEEVAAVFGEGRLVPRVAAAMMGGLEPAIDGIRSLKRALRETSRDPRATPQLATDLVNFAGRVWIDRGAVKALHELLKAGEKLVILNCKAPVVAEWYVHRAGCLKENAPGQFESSHLVDSATLGDAAVISAFDQTLATLLVCEESLDEALEEHNHAKEPIVVWFDGLPPRSAINAIRDRHDAYKKVRMMFLVDYETPPAVALEYPDAVRITPTLDEAAVAAATTAMEAGHDELRRIFREHKKSGQSR